MPSMQDSTTTVVTSLMKVGLPTLSSQWPAIQLHTASLSLNRSHH